MFPAVPQGGAVAYAAAVASALGVRACVVTGTLQQTLLIRSNGCACNDMMDRRLVLSNAMSALAAGSSDADMSVFRGHELHRVATTETLTFEHTYTWWGHRRKLRVTAQPDETLTAAHVPRHCRRARVVLLGPLTPRDMHSASFVHMRTGSPLAA